MSFRRRSRVALFYVTAALLSVVHVIKGELKIEIKRNPTIIYHNAPPGVPVVHVSAYDDVTDEPLDKVDLTSGDDAKYFELVQEKNQAKEYALKVKKKIDKPVGYTFKFNVYARHRGQFPDRRLEINVTKINEFAPMFGEQEYEFLALRQGVNFNLTDIGKVSATDPDEEAYNRVFQYHILDPAAVQYFYVDPTHGQVELIDELPDDVTNMTFTVTAIDAGSPSKLNTSHVTVKITDVRPPDIFCVASDTDATRICWKDPTNGSYVMKYELLLQVDDQNATKRQVDVRGIDDETCSVIDGAQMGKNFTFAVRVLEGLEWSPESIQRQVRIEENGNYGDCKEFSECSKHEPCDNNATCHVTDDDVGYMCNCTHGWAGVNCTEADYCATGQATCQNGGTCLFTGDKTSTCLCPDSFFGTNCEKESPCNSDPCGPGKCLLQGEDYTCKCPDGTTRLSCDVGFCPEDSNFYDKTGRYVWPRTISGDTARVACRHGRKYPIGVGDAIRLCSPSSGGDQYWEAPDTSACLELEEGVVSANLKNLASLTSDASGLRSDEIANITTVLEEYFFFSVENQEIATEMTMVVGNLMDANESVIIESNSKNHSSDRLLWLLDEYVSKVNASSEVSIETENINLKVVNHSTPELGFSYSPELPVSADDDDDDDKTSKQGGVTLNLPPEAMVSMDTPDKEVNPRIQLKTFRSSAFFIPEAEVPPHDVVLKQWVVTAEVNGRSVRNLSTPVEINIQNIENGASHTCVYWDVNNRSWSTEGVVTDAKNIGHTRCLSYHLTSFAILLDPSPDHQISTKHDQILTFISYIGCGISMLGLVLTLITYSLFRCLNREKSGKILMNLCASMLIMNIVFVVGSETSLSASGDVACKVVAILLHYFLLSTLTWMLVEAINMYQALITVFAKYSGYFMLKRCIFAWGFPALVVITTVSISVDNYLTTTELCFLSQGNQVAFFAALLGPACLILLINTAVFIMVSRVILKPRFRGHAANKDDGDTINPAQIRGAFTVMTLLGITWVFGPFAINEAKLVINYVFTVLNSLQGFLIFVFRCLFNPEVRASWLLLVKSGQFKRRRGPVTYTSDTTSSKSDNRSHGSFADTMKTNMYNNSLGKPRNVLNNDHNIDTKNTNLHTKSTKELHPYFDDIQKQKASAPRRPFGSEEYTGRLNGTTGSNHLHSNGLDRNGKDGRYGDENGVTTIYTGKQNGIRRVSGNTTGNDELTRL